MLLPAAGRRAMFRWKPPDNFLFSKSPASRHTSSHRTPLHVRCSHILARRPQIAFLPTSPVTNAQTQPLRRLLTTRRTSRFKYESKIVLGHIVIGLALTFAVVIIVHELLEDSKPSPREWTMWTRMKWQRAHAWRDKKVGGGNQPGWVELLGLYEDLVRRLEDVGIDGKGVLVSPAGLDIGNKSEAWKVGYYECIMGYARACEHMQEWFRDKKSRKLSPRGHIVGQLNPGTVDVPPLLDLMGVKPLREEDVEPAAPLPETVYSKILTTQGFNVKQRVDAAIAYADWLDFKGLHDSAEEAYRWSLDIAMSVIDDPHSAIDIQTSIIKPGARQISENVLNAATALATHLASTAEPAAALPIYLSVLRARRSTSDQQHLVLEQNNSEGATQTRNHTSEPRVTGPLHGVTDWIKSQITEKPFPLPTSTGNEPFARNNAVKDLCDDAKLMGYIGEIIYATSPDETGKSDAIRWTKDAIEQADKGLNVFEASLEEKLQCLDCKQVELDNLLAMTKKLAAGEKERAGRPSSGWPSSGWTMPWSRGTGTNQDDTQRWAEELRAAQMLHNEHGREDMRSRLTVTPAGNLWTYARKFLFI